MQEWGYRSHLCCFNEGISTAGAAKGQIACTSLSLSLFFFFFSFALYLSLSCNHVTQLNLKIWSIYLTFGEHVVC